MRAKSQSRVRLRLRLSLAFVLRLAFDRRALRLAVQLKGFVIVIYSSMEFKEYKSSCKLPICRWGLDVS